MTNTKQPSIRNTDPATRNKALQELVGDDATAVLVVTRGQRTELTYAPGGGTNAQVLPQFFTMLLWAAQQFGRSLGLDLHWLPNPEAQRDKLVVAQPELLR